MVIVLIHWKIKPEPEMVEDFLAFWRTRAVVEDRRGLICEFLSESHSAAEYAWITWQLTGCNGQYRSFINVGYWNSADDFRDQIGKYFGTPKEPERFEFASRLRTILKPRCWRIGDAALPIHDSGGVM